MIGSSAEDSSPAGDPALDRWLAELRTDRAARSRSRVASLRAHAAEDATVVGVLADLAERGATVVLTTTAGVRHRSQVVVVGPDAVVLRNPTHEWLIARLAAVASVRMVGGDPVDGEGSFSTSARFSRIFGAAAEPGDRVRVSIADETIGGAVMAISAEVLQLRLDGGDVCYVNLAAVDDASLDAPVT